jgi:hypothetical protein
MQRHFANDKILCLSDMPDSILMWSYYAQNHAGVALRFTDETPDNPLTMARPVRYVDQMPSPFDRRRDAVRYVGRLRSHGCETDHGTRSYGPNQGIGLMNGSGMYIQAVGEVTARMRTLRLIPWSLIA